MILTLNELIWIDDHITLLNNIGEEGLMSGLPMYEAFILKVGGALLKAEQGQPVEVIITYEEALRIREICQSSGSVGQEEVGMSLKLKIHGRLQQIDYLPIAAEFIDRRREDANSRIIRAKTFTQDRQNSLGSQKDFTPDR